MIEVKQSEETMNFMKSLGFPTLRVHQSNGHFDFTKGGRRILPNLA